MEQYLLQAFHQKPDSTADATQTLFKKVSQRLKAILPFAENTTPKPGTITGIVGEKVYKYGNLDIEFPLNATEIATDTAQAAALRKEAESAKAVVEELIIKLQARSAKYTQILTAITATETKLTQTITAIAKL